MIRPAVMADKQQIVDLAVESVSRDPLPVKVDTAAMGDMAMQMIDNPAHFVWVAEDAGQITACVAACVQPGFWFRGLQASVILFYARRPGEGVALIRQFARWVKSRIKIKLAVFELEPNADPRIARLLYGQGFRRQSMNAVYIREG